jgi:hypothetical protein
LDHDFDIIELDPDLLLSLAILSVQERLPQVRHRWEAPKCRPNLLTHTAELFSRHSHARFMKNEGAIDIRWTKIILARGSPKR